MKKSYLFVLLVLFSLSFVVGEACSDGTLLGNLKIGNNKYLCADSNGTLENLKCEGWYNNKVIWQEKYGWSCTINGWACGKTIGGSLGGFCCDGVIKKDACEIQETCDDWAKTPVGKTLIGTNKELCANYQEQNKILKCWDDDEVYNPANQSTYNNPYLGLKLSGWKCERWGWFCDSNASPVGSFCCNGVVQQEQCIVKIDDCAGKETGEQTEKCDGNNYCTAGVCCGDDANEKYVWQKMGDCGMASDDKTKGVCLTSENDGCAFAIPSNAVTACGALGSGYNNNVFYYAEGKVMGSETPSWIGGVWSNNKAEWYSCVCENNVWVEGGDNSKERCEAGIGVGKTMNTTNKWMGNSCCGDDCFEFYKQGTDGTSACCSSSVDTVKNGKCYNPTMRDVAVSITTPSTAYAGNDVNVNAQVENRGAYDENVDVEFSVKNQNNQTVHSEEKSVSVAKDESKNVNFIWKAIEGIYNFFVSAEIGVDKNPSDNIASSTVSVTKAPYQCTDSDGGKNYVIEGKASLQVSETRIRSYKDGCKDSSTNFLGDFDKNIGPGGGPVINGRVTPYLYEAICENGKPTMVIKECDCYNGKCV